MAIIFNILNSCVSPASWFLGWISLGTGGGKHLYECSGLHWGKHQKDDKETTSSTAFTLGSTKGTSRDDFDLSLYVSTQH